MDSVFDIWSDLAQMAKDLGRPYQTVAAWRRRGIPARHDPEIVEAARKRGAELSLDYMAEARRAFLATRKSARATGEAGAYRQEAAE